MVSPSEVLDVNDSASEVIPDPAYSKDARSSTEDLFLRLQPDPQAAAEPRDVRTRVNDPCLSDSSRKVGVTFFSPVFDEGCELDYE